jgi:hypothetical protein
MKLSNHTVTVALLAFLGSAGYVHAAEENMSMLRVVKSPDDSERELLAAPAAGCAWVKHGSWWNGYYWQCENNQGNYNCTKGGRAGTCRDGSGVVGNGFLHHTGDSMPTVNCTCVCDKPTTKKGIPKAAATSIGGVVP